MHTQHKAVLFAMVAALAACSDNTTAPQPMTDAAPVATTEGSMLGLSVTDTIRFTITIDPSRLTTFSLGAGNSLVFPEGSLCSLNSSYGPSEWDKPCTKATQPVKVNVKAWLDRFGKASIDFDKHIRFVPSNNPSQWVVLSFGDMEAALNPFFNILYCPGTSSGFSGNGACYDESKKDPSLITVRNPLTGRITRRIKHFSGYNVAAGRDDGEADSWTNVSSSWTPSFSISVGDMQFDSIDEVRSTYPGMSASDAEEFLGRVREAKRSGYILASG